MTMVIKYNKPLPEWAKYLAREKDGEIWCYENKPVFRENEGVWRPFEGMAERYPDYDGVYRWVLWKDIAPALISSYDEDTHVSLVNRNSANGQRYTYEQGHLLL